MRRRPGTLLPLELDILGSLAGRLAAGDGWRHGFGIAADMRDSTGSKRLTAHGTLYKALGRLEANGMVQDRWEDPEVGAAEGRPRRRLYRITTGGQRALADARDQQLGAEASGHGDEPGMALA